MGRLRTSTVQTSEIKLADDVLNITKKSADEAKSSSSRSVGPRMETRRLRRARLIESRSQISSMSNIVPFNADSSKENRNASDSDSVDVTSQLDFMEGRLSRELRQRKQKKELNQAKRSASRSNQVSFSATSRNIESSFESARSRLNREAASRPTMRTRKRVLTKF